MKLIKLFRRSSRLTNPRVMKEKLDNVDNENNKNEVVDLFVSHDKDFVGNFVLNLIKE